tara:strand:- start:3 stop:290 length:288 start_codon:yes stop_codon:yes gene_type:complete
MSRRIARIDMGNELLSEILQFCSPISGMTLSAGCSVRSNVPDDLRLLYAETDHARNVTSFYCISDAFAEVPDGGEPPLFDVDIEASYWDPVTSLN